MEYVVVSLVAVLVSALTVFSGFGLGTVLMPAFALFFPVPIAIAATAVVHLANNIFKVFLVGRHADWSVVVRFALPGAVAAVIGAMTLNLFAATPPLMVYTIGSRAIEVTAVKLIIGLLISGFAVFELLPALTRLAFDRRYLPVGGLLSGFFGGLSGNQGALRSAFLIKSGLEKETFIGTGTVSAVVVDLARLVVYGLSFYTVPIAGIREIAGLVMAATLAAFVGAFLASRYLRKVTLRTIQGLVGVMLVVVGLGMASGIL